MTDKCLDAYLNDPYTVKTQPKLQWMGQYKAIQINSSNGMHIAAPMNLLKIDNPPKKPEDYWRDVINNAGLYFAIWGNRIMFSQYANDAMGFGLADKDTPQNQRMEVYKINPHWLSLCLDSPPNARYLHMRNPFVNDPPMYPGIAEEFTDFPRCPTSNDARISCPTGTISSNTNGYCYDVQTNNMVSTYYIPVYDYCPEDPASVSTKQQPMDRSGTRVWNRQSGIDTNVTLNYNSVCPPQNQSNAPCPPSTISSNYNGYCYDPVGNTMVSTYFVGEYDKCPENPASASTNKGEPRTIDNVRVWNRQSGLDSNYTFDFSAKCPTENYPDCPRDTYSCNQKGYCFDPTTNQMVSTYMLGDYDKCPEDPSSTKTNMPRLINNVRVWKRQQGLDQNAQCKSWTQKLGEVWDAAKEKLNSSDAMNLGELQQDATRLRTLHAQRGEETRQELENINAAMNAKNRYLDLMKQENNDWDLTIHALLTFFFVLALCVIPTVGWLSGKLTTRAFAISVFVLFALYIIYLVYQIRRTNVRDFIEPSYKQVKVSFGQLDNYLREQADIAQANLTEFVNENCSCPTETPSVRTPTRESQIDGLPVSKRFYTPGAMTYADISAPHQIIDPEVVPNRDGENFTIEWTDAWRNSTIQSNKISQDEIRDILSNVGVPFDRFDDGITKRGSQDLSKLVLMGDNIQSPASPFGVPVTVYVKTVLEYIYRGKRAVTASMVADGVKKFRDGTYGMNKAGACDYIKSIFASPTFRLTFGSTLQWYKYACMHPFLDLAANETLTKRL